MAASTSLSRSPQLRAGQIEMHRAVVRDAAKLFLPLPMQSLQLTVDNLRAYLNRQEERERKTGRDWFDPEWRRGLLGAMRDISGDLATLAAYLPIAQRLQRWGRRSNPRKRRKT